MGSLTTFDQAEDKLRWLMDDAEDLLAEKMEQALDRGKGERYQTRSAHGCIPALTRCRVWRTKAGVIGILVEEALLLKERKKKTQLIVDSNKYRQQGKVYVYDYERGWYFERLEEPAALRLALMAHEATKKHPRRVPTTFLPY